MEPDIFTLYAVSAFGILALLAVAGFAYRLPAAAVNAAYLLIPIAETRFRRRDPAAALAGDVDAQILVEVGLYGLLAVIAAALLVRHRRLSLGLIEISLVGYGLVCLASSVWSLAPLVTFVRACQVLLLVVLTWSAVRVTGPEHAMRAVVASSTMYVLGCVTLVVLAPELTLQRDDGRFGWFAVPPVEAGSYAALAAVLVLSAGGYGERGWRSRMLWCPIWLFPLPLFGVLLLTGSRGPLLAFIGGAGILMLKRLEARVATVLLCLGILVFVTLIGSSATLSRVLEDSAGQDTAVRWLLRGQTADQFLGMTGRAELWSQVVGHFYNRPVQGHGYQASRSFLLDTARWAGHAHNAYLQTLLDVGIVGAVLLFAPFFAVFARSLRKPHGTALRWDEAAGLAAIVFLSLNSITDQSVAVPGYQLAVALMCLATAVRRDALRLSLRAGTRDRRDGGASRMATVLR